MLPVALVLLVCRQVYGAVPDFALHGGVPDISGVHRVGPLSGGEALAGEVTRVGGFLVGRVRGAHELHFGFVGRKQGGGGLR